MRYFINAHFIFLNLLTKFVMRFNIIRIIVTQIIEGVAEFFLLYHSDPRECFILTYIHVIRIFFPAIQEQAGSK